MLTLGSAPSLIGTPGLTAAGGPMVRAPRRHNVSSVRRLHPYTQEYLEKCRALGSDSTGILASENIEHRYGVDRWTRGTINRIDWAQVCTWLLRSGQSIGSGTVVPSHGGLGSHNGTLVASPVWASDWMSFVPAGSHMTVTLPTDSNQISVLAVANILSSAATGGIFGFGALPTSTTNLTDFATNSGNLHHLTFGNGSSYISKTPRFGIGPRFFGLTTGGSGSNIIAYQDSAALSTTAQGTATPTLENFTVGRRFYDPAHSANLSESFVGIVSGIVSVDQYLAFRNLYKAHLGPDLGLQ